MKAVATELKWELGVTVGTPLLPLVSVGGVLGSEPLPPLAVQVFRLPRLTFPRKMLSVRAWADSSGYMESSICMEFSCFGGVELADVAAGDIEFSADTGCLQGTGTACFGVAEPNCSGEEGTLLQGEGVVIMMGVVMDAGDKDTG